jgi:hypothetical protein
LSRTHAEVLLPDEARTRLWVRPVITGHLMRGRRCSDRRACQASSGHPGPVDPALAGSRLVPWIAVRDAYPNAA